MEHLKNIGLVDGKHVRGGMRRNGRRSLFMDTVIIQTLVLVSELVGLKISS